MLDKKKLDYLKNFSDEELIEYLVVVKGKETDLDSAMTNTIDNETIQESGLSPEQIQKLKIAEAFAGSTKPKDKELELIQRALKPIKKMTQANAQKKADKFGREPIFKETMEKIISPEEKQQRNVAVESVKKILDR
tara:strand:- start:49 stop:456 length:408 start_codon:yes stop_codon:yes gene_type:complete